MKKKLKEIDVRKTKSFQIKRAKELGMTMNQYLGIDPFQTIEFKKKKK